MTSKRFFYLKYEILPYQYQLLLKNHVFFFKSMDGIIREEDVRLDPDGYRRISTTSTVSGYGTESDRDPTQMYDTSKGPHWRWSYRKSIGAGRRS